MITLGIETSCDETAAAIVEDGQRILSDVVASQVAVHRPYGGVVPEVASRQHILNVLPVVQEPGRGLPPVSNGTQLGSLSRPLSPVGGGVLIEWS